MRKTIYLSWEFLNARAGADSQSGFGGTLGQAKAETSYATYRDRTVRYLLSVDDIPRSSYVFLRIKDVATGEGRPPNPGMSPLPSG